jgi:hypothetical protein
MWSLEGMRQLLDKLTNTACLHCQGALRHDGIVRSMDIKYKLPVGEDRFKVTT